MTEKPKDDLAEKLGLGPSNPPRTSTASPAGTAPGPTTDPTSPTPQQSQGQGQVASKPPGWTPPKPQEELDEEDSEDEGEEVVDPNETRMKVSAIISSTTEHEIRASDYDLPADCTTAELLAAAQKDIQDEGELEWILEDIEPKDVKLEAVGKNMPAATHGV
jgi:hypothetical protein